MSYINRHVHPKPELTVSKQPKRKKPDETNWRSARVSLRLDKAALQVIDDVAERNGVARNRVIGLVLREYCVERGAATVDAIVREQEAADAAQINLFD